MKMIHMTVPGHEEATLEGYILDCELKLGQDTKRPAIVVCPGGGYLYCSPREAEPVALRYAASGFHAFILRYSVGWDAGDFAPLQEVCRGVEHRSGEDRHLRFLCRRPPGPGGRRDGGE